MKAFHSEKKVGSLFASIAGSDLGELIQSKSVLKLLMQKTIIFFKFQEAQNLKVHQASSRLKWLAKAEIFSKSNKYQPPILGPRQKWLKSQKRRQLGHKLWGAAENRDL